MKAQSSTPGKGFYEGQEFVRGRRKNARNPHEDANDGYDNSKEVVCPLINKNTKLNARVIHPNLRKDPSIIPIVAHNNDVLHRTQSNGTDETFGKDIIVTTLGKSEEIRIIIRYLSDRTFFIKEVSEGILHRELKNAFFLFLDNREHPTKYKLWPVKITLKPPYKWQENTSKSNKNRSELYCHGKLIIPKNFAGSMIDIQGSENELDIWTAIINCFK